MSQIPTLNIQDFLSQDQARRADFVGRLGRAYQDIGFVVIQGHNVSPELQSRAYEKIAAFFAMTPEQKRRFEIPGIGGARGYTTFGKEHAKDTPVGDLKEFFHVGAEVPASHPLAKEYPSNVSVAEIPGFDVTLRDLYSSLLSLGTEMLRAISLFLEIPENYFDEKVRYGNSILRPIHYPPLTGREDPRAVRSSAHEDINLITLLIGASAPGLEVKNRQGEWVGVTTKAHEIVVNVGDMLQRLTNYRLVSTTHRVVNPPASAVSSATRFSIPFFLHPVSQMSLKALPTCVGPQNPQRDPDILAGDYLHQRLREIGLA